MDFNEIRPRCGWVAMRRRMAIAEKVKTIAMAVAVIAAYTVMVSVCETI